LQCPVPEGWKLPTSNVAQLWNIWHFGDISSRVRPIKKISPMFLRNKCDRVGLTRVKGVMNWIEDRCRSDNLLQKDVNIADVTVSESDNLLSHGYSTYLYGLETDFESRRVGDLSYNSIYEKMCRKRRREQDDI
jgi:hypothetical protein